MAIAQGHKQKLDKYKHQILADRYDWAMEKAD